MQALQNHLIVEPFESPSEVNGIIIPDSIKERSAKARVISAGSRGNGGKPMIFKKGYTVFHIKDCGEEINHEGKTYFRIRDTDVLAYLEN